jgi:hypothetical protein
LNYKAINHSRRKRPVKEKKGLRKKIVALSFMDIVAGVPKGLREMGGR